MRIKLSAVLIATLTLQCQCAYKSHPACKVARSNFIDVTHTDPDKRNGDSVEEGVWGFPAPQRSKPYPIEVYLSRINRKRYKSRQRVIYDVTLKNTSDETVTVPWSPIAIMKKDRPASGYRHCEFEFMVTSGEGEQFVVDRFFLFGSAKIQNSLRDIRPHECVTIRIPALLFGTGLETNYKFFKTNPARFSFNLGFLMYVPDDPDFMLGIEVFSRNQLPVQIKNEIKYSR